MIHRLLRHRWIAIVAVLVTTAQTAFVAAAPPSQPHVGSSTDFAQTVDLAPLARVAVYEDGRLNSFESFARKRMHVVSGSQRIDGQSPVFTYIDLTLRPSRYENLPIIFVKKKPVRAQIIDALEHATPEPTPAFEHDMASFLETGLIAPPYLQGDAALDLLGRMRQDVIRTARFVDQIDSALFVRQSQVLLGSWRVIPPAGDDAQRPWLAFDGLMRAGDVEGLDEATRASVMTPWRAFVTAWIQEDADGVNTAAAALAAALPAVNPELYPDSSRGGWPWAFDRDSAWGWGSTVGVMALLIVGLMMSLGRNAWSGARLCAALLTTLLGLAAFALWLGGQDPLALETFYFRSYNLTWIWTFYAIALAPLLLSIVFRWQPARWVGLGLFWIAFAGHSAAVLLRWYVADRWPNSNMFEAVTTAAWFGGVCAFGLEAVAGRSSMRSVFALGSATASMVALMCAFFLPLDLDASISNRMPVLHDVWLYIHTNVIIFSYCLIFMAAVSASLYLVFRLFRNGSGPPGHDEYARVGGAGTLIADTAGRTTLGQVLDGTTMVLMELSFVMLWTGLVMGAIWADHSWGRPWGWDPKEVFALNTFLVFAVLVHVRIKSRDKGLWTALIALAGAAVMLFNWIAINFVITGLHSYA